MKKKQEKQEKVAVMEKAVIEKAVIEKLSVIEIRSGNRKQQQ